jgi:hypothetical protein
MCRAHGRAAAAPEPVSVSGPSAKVTSLTVRVMRGVIVPSETSRPPTLTATVTTPRAALTSAVLIANDRDPRTNFRSAVAVTVPAPNAGSRLPDCAVSDGGPRPHAARAGGTIASHSSVRRLVILMPLAFSALPVFRNASPPNARCTGSGRLETSAGRAVRNAAGGAEAAGTASIGAETYHPGSERCLRTEPGTQDPNRHR